MKSPPHQNLELLIFGALAFGLMVTAPYIWAQYHAETVSLLADVKGYPKNQQVTLEKISDLIVLPADEFPTQAIIQNTQNYVDHPFLSKARPGDYLLIYPEENLVVVYRPSLNKIVITGPARENSSEFLRSSTTVNSEENEANKQ